MSDELKLSNVTITPFADGISFGAAGPYTLLTGTAIIRLDPNNSPIKTLKGVDYVERDETGRILITSAVTILKPVQKPSIYTRAVFEFCNRGNLSLFKIFDGVEHTNLLGELRSSGSEFLLRHGLTLIWLGWQGDLEVGDGRMTVSVPAARTNDGETIGKVFREYITDEENVSFLPLNFGTKSIIYEPTTLDNRHAKLTKRRRREEVPLLVDPSRWSFGIGDVSLNDQRSVDRCKSEPLSLHIHDGFEAGSIYELSYTAKGALINEFGFAAVASFIKFLKRSPDPEDDFEHIDRIDIVYAFGVSQAARAIREFIYRGYNALDSVGKLFDGALLQGGGAGRLCMNPFHDLSEAASQQYENNRSQSDQFPFSYALCTDHLSGVEDAIFKRPASDPFLIDVLSSTEYWQRRGSLLHTDTKGEDLKQGENVRLYFLPGTQHACYGVFNSKRDEVSYYAPNPIRASAYFRAFLKALDDWVAFGVIPPETRVPTRQDGTLVEFKEWAARYPVIPGLELPREPNTWPTIEKSYDKSDLLGLISIRSEFDAFCVSSDHSGGLYKILLPTSDVDGNDLGGVRIPEIALPVGTFLGWNLRKSAFENGNMRGFMGSYIPFFESKCSRLQVNDPRLSLIERYTCTERYKSELQICISELIAERFILPEDNHIDSFNLWPDPNHGK